MLPSASKRLSLPFSNPKTKTAEIEAALVFTVAELNRGRGGGIFNRQSQETTLFIAQLGYPIWVYTKNNGSTLAFDGLGCFSYSVSYDEAPSATKFMENLQKYQLPRDSYTSFLCDHQNYFQQPPQNRQFVLRGLIENREFYNELSIYQREATEPTQSNTLLSPILEEAAISANFSALDELLAHLSADNNALSESLKLVKKITGQYLTEIEFDATAAKEEADAKIKATQEFVNPETVKLTREFHRKIKALSSNFDKAIEELQKQVKKTEKAIASAEANIRVFEKNAKAAGKKGHEVYEKRWKDKAKDEEKELSSHKKALKNLENDINRLIRQKAAEVTNLNGELEATLKQVKQQIVDLESERDQKVFAYKQESNRLVACEKPVVEGMESSIKLREATACAFEGLTLHGSHIKTSMLLYVPFYAVCYQATYSKRYLCIPPSVLAAFDFSAKLRGALGVSKAKEMIIPRFRAIASLVAKAEELSQQSTAFEGQLWRLGTENNLLHNDQFRQAAKAGLGGLQQAGWLSEREVLELSAQLSA
jgi:hypothetical protein